MEFFDKKDVTIKESVQHDIPIHQVLLAFNGDVQAEAFVDWWTRVGIDVFKIWTEAEGENYG